MLTRLMALSDFAEMKKTEPLWVRIMSVAIMKQLPGQNRIRKQRLLFPTGKGRLIGFFENNGLNFNVKSDRRTPAWLRYFQVRLYIIANFTLNLKTGITKNTRDELVINRSYREMAEHYGTAIIPARPRAPKDKAAVEGTVGVVSTFILAALRNQQFLSLSELNEAVWDRLYGFNHKPFQKKNGSRASAFEEEKIFLLPLPGHPFELATWRIATVQYNYHISVDTQNYSCPYEYIKQKVDVRMTRSTVEIFFDGNRIASHPRLYGRPNQYCTLEAHMPPDHLKYIQWNGERFISWAEKVGPNTTSVIRLFLNRYAVEQQGYKSCMALLKLTDKYPPQRLEAACSKAFSFTASPSLKSIQSILHSGQDKLPEQEVEKSSTSQYGFTRGAGYYDRRDD